MSEEWREALRQYEEEQKQKRIKAKEKAAKTREYLRAKPDCIITLEMNVLLCTGKRVTYDDRTANGLTTFCLDWLMYHGHYGARINTGGTAIGAIGAGGREKIKWTTSGSTKGVADIIACVNGHFCQFEIKAGKDRPREDQKIQQQLTIKAGGSYEFIHSATEFVQSVTQIEQLYPRNGVMP